MPLDFGQTVTGVALVSDGQNTRRALPRRVVTGTVIGLYPTSPGVALVDIGDEEVLVKVNRVAESPPDPLADLAAHRIVPSTGEARTTCACGWIVEALNPADRARDYRAHAVLAGSGEQPGETLPGGVVWAEVDGVKVLTTAPVVPDSPAVCATPYPGARPEWAVGDMRCAMPLGHHGPHHQAGNLAWPDAALPAVHPTATAPHVKAEALREAADAEEARCAGDWNGTTCDICKASARRLRERAARIARDGGGPTAPQAPGVTREQVAQIVERVQSQRFTDDDGNDVGTMSGGHAWAAVLLTLNALGIPDVDAPAAPEEGRA